MPSNLLDDIYTFLSTYPEFFGKRRYRARLPKIECENMTAFCKYHGYMFKTFEWNVAFVFHFHERLLQRDSVDYN